MDIKGEGVNEVNEADVKEIVKKMFASGDLSISIEIETRGDDEVITVGIDDEYGNKLQSCTAWLNLK